MFNDPAEDPFEGIPEAPPSLAVQASRALRDLTASERARRLWRSEEAIVYSTQLEREALCNWLGGMLHRPPLERPTPAFRPMRAIVEALWWDLSERTPDPLEPLALSPLILAEHPWGEGSES